MVEVKSIIDKFQFFYNNGLTKVGNMNFEAVKHTIRASRNLTGVKRFLVCGSQVVLLHLYVNGYETNFEFHDSSEIDLAPIPEN